MCDKVTILDHITVTYHDNIDESNQLKYLRLWRLVTREVHTMGGSSCAHTAGVHLETVNPSGNETVRNSSKTMNQR